MKNIVITSGEKYIDIDAYAGCIGYKTLLNAQSIDAYAVTTAPFNESIPALIKNLSLSFDKYIPSVNDKFIVLDVSDPGMFDKIINVDNIIEIIDHHTGFEDFWSKKHNVHNQIEFIGSICTVIYEKYVEENRIDLLTSDLCKLLTAAILDNTLNLKAKITTARDARAFYDLMKIGKLNNNWPAEYFEACEQEILNDLAAAIVNDIKCAKANKNLPDVFGQLAIFNSDKILEKLDLIKKTFCDYKDWMINIICLKSGKSFLIADKPASKAKLEKLFNKTFNGDILELEKFMLRKEIIKKAYEV